MSVPPTHYENCIETHRRIEKIMPTDRWKAIKSAFYAVITVAFATFSIVMDAQPTVAFVMGGFMLLVFFGVETHEVEIAKWVSITFKNGEEKDTETE